MTEPKFTSNLPETEIKEHFEGVDFFEGTMSGLEEALAYEKGNAKAATIARKRSLPEINVARTRKELNLTQKAFAAILGVSPRTVEAWEAGKSNPSPTARNLIYLIEQDHSLLPYRGTSCQEEKDRSGVTPSASPADFPVIEIQPDLVPA